ncbi:MAG: hypothetical protein DI577_04315, partial [Microbacterium sp.]
MTTQSSPSDADGVTTTGGVPPTDAPSDTQTSTAEASAPVAEFQFGSNEAVEVAPVVGDADVVTVSGRLVDSETGAGVAGMEVSFGTFGAGKSLSGLPETGGSADGTSVVSAEDGSFSFQTTETTQGYVDFRVNDSVASAHIGGWGGLTSATRGFAYDLGAIALTPGAVLSGDLTVDAAPVDTVSVSVQVFAVGAQWSAYSWYHQVQTGDATEWAVVVAPGSYQVQLANGSVFPEQWWNGVSSRAAAQTVAVSAGDHVTDIDGVLSFAGSSISGVVRNAQGTPVTGGSVNAWTSTGASAYSSIDAQGRYFLSNLAPGSYQVSVSWRDDRSPYSVPSPVVIPSGAPVALTGT